MQKSPKSRKGATTTANQPPPSQSFADILASPAVGVASFLAAAISVAAFIVNALNGDYLTIIIATVVSLLTGGLGAVQVANSRSNKLLRKGIVLLVVGCIGLGVIGDQVFGYRNEKTNGAALSTKSPPNPKQQLENVSGNPPPNSKVQHCATLSGTAKIPNGLDLWIAHSDAKKADHPDFFYDKAVSDPTNPSLWSLRATIGSEEV